MNNNFLFLTALILLSGCSYNGIHKNHQQVISSNEASYPLKDLEKLYVFHAPNYKIIKEYVDLNLITSAESDFILNSERIPISFMLTVTREGKCYKILTGEIENPDKVVVEDFARLSHIRDGYYILSTTKEGCFDKGVDEIHIVDIIEITGNNFQIAMDAKSFNASFKEWASSLDKETRRRYGIFDGNVVNDVGNIINMGLKVFNILAYQEYFKSHFRPYDFKKEFDDGWVSRIPPTQKEKNAMMILEIARERKKELSK